MKDVLCREMLCAEHLLFFWKDDLYSLIVYQHINSIVRTEAVKVDAFFKSTEEPLAVTRVFYNAFLSISSIRHEH